MCKCVAAMFLHMLLLLSASISLAEDQVATVTPNGSVDTATVTIDGIDLFPVRGVTAYPAERRARDIEARIESIANNKNIPSNQHCLQDVFDQWTLAYQYFRHFIADGRERRLKLLNVHLAPPVLMTRLSKSSRVFKS